jgi:hypothetical protein
MFAAAAAVAATIAAFSLPPGSDTTLVVPKGLNLDVANYSGEVLIDGWSRNALRIRTDHYEQDKVLVRPVDKGLLIKAYSKHDEERGAVIRLTVPEWMNLDISGIHTDVVIAGTEGQVRVETVHGDVLVKGGRRKINLATVNQDICLSDAIGTIAAETVNGDAYLWRIDSDSVSVSTVNGLIAYEGTVHDKGVYQLTSHNGDISMGMPASASASVAISTFSGDFESSFPVTLTEKRAGNRFQFCVKTGSARVELESFQGTIQIYKSGPTPSPRIQKIDKLSTKIYAKYLGKPVGRIERARSSEEAMEKSPKFEKHEKYGKHWSGDEKDPDEDAPDSGEDDDLP